MRPEELSSILQKAGLADAEEAQALRDQLDPRGATLQQTIQILRRNEDELLETLVGAVAPALPDAQLTQLIQSPNALQHVAAHDAWDYLILPVSFDHDGTLLCVTTEDTLAIAIAFLFNHTAQPFRLQLAGVGPLEQYIAERYAYEGIAEAA